MGYYNKREDKYRMDVSIDFESPSVKEFNSLREAVGWRLMSEKATQRSLYGSLFCCCVREQQKMVGFGRIIGDGAMYFYLQDVMIHPDHQGKGVGSSVMQHLEAWLADHLAPGGTAALLAATGKEGFYKRYGYQVRPDKDTGAGMSKFVLR